jgi:hypothetical protein
MPVRALWSPAGRGGDQGPKSGLLVVLVVVAGLLALYRWGGPLPGLFGSGGAWGPKGSQPSLLELAGPGRQAGYHHVAVELANVVGDQETDFATTAHLPRWTTVRVVQREGGWWRVRWEGREGWVPFDILQPGDGSEAFEQHCLDGRGPPLHNGEVVEAKGETGRAHLDIDNNGADAILIRLVQKGGPSRRTIFVAPGAKARLDGVPSGVYDVLVITGRDYSRACGTFVRGLRVDRLDHTFSFEEKRGAGGQIRWTNHTLTMRAVAGNLHRLPADRRLAFD